MDSQQLPHELTALPQWVCWRLEPDEKGGKDKKVPYCPLTSRKASSTNPKHWSTFGAAQAACEQYLYGGVGFVFTKDSGMVGIDIDNCRDPHTGALNETASAIVQRLSNTYTEISPSGTGIHLFLRGVMPGKGNRNAKTGVEMYGDGRYFTVSGRPIGGAPLTLCRDEVALRWVFDTYIKQPVKEKTKKSREASGAPAKLTDEELLDRARSAKNGDAFAALWDGNWQDAYGSQSEADFALCGKLAFWTGKDAERMDRLFRQSALYRKKWDKAHHAGGVTYGAETIARAIEGTEETYSPDADNFIFGREGRYYRCKSTGIAPITNFVCEPLEMVVTDEDACLTADFKTTDGETYRTTLMTTDFNSLQKFKGVLNRRTISLSFTGGEADMELLKGYLARLPWKMKRGVRAMGLHEHNGEWAFVTTDGAVNRRGWAVDDITQPEKHKSIETVIAKTNPIGTDTLKTLGPLLLRYNEPEKTASILAWVAGCFIKEHLRLQRVKFPHLGLIGEAGSGKSTTQESVIMAVFGCERIVAASQITGFSLMESSASSNLIPQALDEFKPSKIDRPRLGLLLNHMRDSYDGHAGLRGRTDLSVRSYLLHAPLIYAGEESPNEAAIRERSIELLFSKRDLKGRGCRAAFDRLSGMRDTLGSFGRALLDTALATTRAEAEQWYRDALPLFGDEIPSRVANNLACCMAGLRLVEKLCAVRGLAWHDVLPLGPDACAAHMQSAACEYALGGGSVTKGAVEEALEIMNRMGLNGDTCRFMDGDTRVAICFTNVYDRYTKYRRDHAIMGECLEYRQFMRQLGKSDLHVETKNVRFADGIHRAAVLDYTALAQRCEVSGFNLSGVEPLLGTG